MLSAKTFPLTDMNRSELQDQLIQQIIDDMDIKTMAALLYDMMDESYDCLLYTSPSPRDRG